MRANPCGLLKPGVTPRDAADDDWLIKCLCPPNYTVGQAVDVVIEEKARLYEDRQYFQRAFKSPSQGDAFVDQVPHYDRRVVECVKDVCQYLVDTHGRFPAHADGLFVPGVWLQAHHLNLDYYDAVFGGRGYTETQRDHESHWHQAHEHGANAPDALRTDSRGSSS
jgi:hypothetical protein